MGEWKKGKERDIVTKGWNKERKNGDGKKGMAWMREKAKRKEMNVKKQRRKGEYIKMWVVKRESKAK